MTPEDLDAIEARSKRAGLSPEPSLDDIPALVAEIRRLHLEQIRRTAELEVYHNERYALLDIETARLRAAIKKAAQLCYAHPSLADEIRGLA